MIYKGNDIDVRSGDVVLYHTGFLWYRPGTWLSAAIRFFTGIKYNHVAIVVSSWDMLMLNEAKEWGVIARPAANHLERYDTSIAVLRLKAPVNEKYVCQRANSKLGVPYDFKTLLWYQLKYRIFHVWTGLTGDAAAQSFVCSEYVAWCFDLPYWWLCSAKEIMNCNLFEKVYAED